MYTNQQYQTARMSRDPRFDGVFFIAVKTTGVYCRPICPANAPKEDNVEYFQSAIEASKCGYRPCLRCRPDSAPQSNPWLGTETTVNRAISILLSENEPTSMVSLAERLGISDRYLRKLFNEKVGVTPLQFQIYHNLLLAKKLLHQTQMPISDIAFACGFNSIRQFNASFKQHFRFPPSQIRKAQNKEQDVISVSLAFRPPYNWQILSEFLRKRAIDNVEVVTVDSYSRTVTIDNESHGWFCATFNEEQNTFDLDIKVSDLKMLKPMIANISRCLDLNANLHIIEPHLVRAGIPEERLIKGLRVPGIWSSFEAGIRAILGQQVSVKAARTLVQKLVDALGEDNVCNSESVNFPTPKAIASSDLAFLPMPQRRKETLINFANYMRDSANEKGDLGHWLSLKGIGPWTVDYAKFRGENHPDIWLDGDLGIKKANNLFKGKLAPDNASPWRSYLTFQLWQHL
ncbi:DNA-3-methyladenine glycosylase 2 family protein [Flocculibacter collagenilyticus]|uniref:DNA-3-methyladenine glycosylase 2 family protein n=1 Tax=Flocculibacter collagenilyticus TaxID=2744479 RepID=UPI0018F5F901|nr:AlkA N-terminal domain-containing protein [Flocculibacter collagenilyticus]